MKEIIIFANGDIVQGAIELPAKSLLIAADGGARHCLNLGLQPQVVIGDFDSLTPKEIDALKVAGAEFIRHPADKDETDLELALNYALQTGAQTITIYGLLGGRWDMSFANLLLLAAPRYATICFRIWAGDTEAFILRGGETLELRGQPGDIVSVIPLNGQAEGITYQGLRWPLEAAGLPFGSPRGVSNTLAEKKATIDLEKGTLLATIIHEDKTHL